MYLKLKQKWLIVLLVMPVFNILFNNCHERNLYVTFGPEMSRGWKSLKLKTVDYLALRRFS